MWQCCSWEYCSLLSNWREGCINYCITQVYLVYSTGLIPYQLGASWYQTWVWFRIFPNSCEISQEFISFVCKAVGVYYASSCAMFVYTTMSYYIRGLLDHIFQEYPLSIVRLVSHTTLRQWLSSAPDQWLQLTGPCRMFQMRLTNVSPACPTHDSPECLTHDSCAPRNAWQSVSSVLSHGFFNLLDRSLRACMTSDSQHTLGQGLFDKYFFIQWLSM